MICAERRWYVACLLFALFGVISIDVVGGAEDAEAEGIFAARVAELKTAGSAVSLAFVPRSEEKSFAGWSFFVLRLRVYPVRVTAQTPLKTNNVFAVFADKVIMITDEKELEQFFKDNLGAITGEMALRQATAAWLRLAQELHHDGFFEFTEPSVVVRGTSGIGAVKVVEQKGDKGKLTVTLEFQDKKLQMATYGGKLSAGIRPRCQAMHLLDEDPVIREIMRRDILVMGSDCKWYLDEVRASASPRMQQAIDEVWQQILDEGR